MFRKQKKSFLLCVGAPKTGTTWLYHQLKSAPNFAKGVFKEYHVWDALYIPQDAFYARITEKKIAADPRLLLRRELLGDPNLYFAHFEALMQSENAQVAGDFTPEYMNLPADVFARIQAGFAEKGMKTRALFIMRDPVERVISHYRMRKSRQPKKFARFEWETNDDRGLAEHVDRDRADLRADYMGTVESLLAAFPEDQIGFFFYEEMFAPEQIERLNAFCGVKISADAGLQKIHDFPLELEFSPEVLDAVAERYRAQYEFCAQVFPQTQALWPGFARLGRL